MLKKVLMVSLILSCLSFAKEDKRELSVEEVKKIANSAIKELHHAIKENVQKNYTQKGIVGAANFCINSAEDKSAEVNKKLGEKTSIKRVSFKNRNEKNYPLEEEKSILEAFKLLDDAHTYLPELIVQMVDENTYKVYKPISMEGKLCKQCHGKIEKLKPEVRNLISKHYPNDKAINHPDGSLRGAFVVTIKR